MDITCGVVKFFDGVLLDILINKLGKPQYIQKNKGHITYFQTYLKDLSCKTIVLESPYIDKDFLEDFADYYSRCFCEYDKHCTRLHFFDIDFTQDEFDIFSIAPDGSDGSKTLQKHYLGFIVVTPLPEKFIGKTCLKTYNTAARRNYPITQPYCVHLLGTTLHIDSLAFQEQDRAVSACATSALWSVFQGSGIIFHHSIPSPVKITQAASQHLLLNQRPFPNDGLTPYQIAHAIKNVGLEPLLLTINNEEHILTSNIYSYQKASIPLLLIIQLIQLDASTCKFEEDKGNHGVAVTGFSTGHSTPSKFKNTDFFCESTKIDKIYVHDDQVGPFARMELVEKVIEDNSGKKPYLTLTTSWPAPTGKIIVALPKTLIAPLYHKIRIPYSTIEEVVAGYDGIIKSLIKPATVDISGGLVWDIELIAATKLKKEYSDNTAVNAAARRKILYVSLPKYVWRARARVLKTDNLILELLFDATGLEQSRLLTCYSEFGYNIFELIKVAGKNPAYVNMLSNPLHQKIVYWSDIV